MFLYREKHLTKLPKFVYHSRYIKKRIEGMYQEVCRQIKEFKFNQSNNYLYVILQRIFQ